MPGEDTEGIQWLSKIIQLNTVPAYNSVSQLSFLILFVHHGVQKTISQKKKFSKYFLINWYIYLILITHVRAQTFSDIKSFKKKNHHSTQNIILIMFYNSLIKIKKIIWLIILTLE